MCRFVSFANTLRGTYCPRPTGYPDSKKWSAGCELYIVGTQADRQQAASCARVTAPLQASSLTHHLTTVRSASYCTILLYHCCCVGRNFDAMHLLHDLVLQENGKQKRQENHKTISAKSRRKPAAVQHTKKRHLNFEFSASDFPLSFGFGVP